MVEEMKGGTLETLSRLCANSTPVQSQLLRKPTSEADALAWWHRALNDKYLHLDLEIDYTGPECGFYYGRLCRGGPMLPARIWIEQEVDPDTGELLSDEVFRCEINGIERDPFEAWIFLASEPITKESFEYLIARKQFAEDFAPDEPAANPFRKVDWSKVPNPTF